MGKPIEEGQVGVDLSEIEYSKLTSCVTATVFLINPATGKHGPLGGLIGGHFAIGCKNNPDTVWHMMGQLWKEYSEWGSPIAAYMIGHLDIWTGESGGSSPDYGYPMDFLVDLLDTFGGGFPVYELSTPDARVKVRMNANHSVSVSQAVNGAFTPCGPPASVSVRNMANATGALGQRALDVPQNAFQAARAGLHHVVR